MLVLASESPRRKKLLKDLDIDFIAVSSHVVENTQSIFPKHVPLLLAEQKAEAVAGLYPNDFVLGADTIVSINGEIIGKPKDIEEARCILAKLSNKVNQVITGVCLIKKNSFLRTSFIEVSNVYFKKLTQETIDIYVNKVNTLDKAGAYAIQEFGDLIIDKIEGSFTNIMGLPCEKLTQTLNILDPL